MSASDKTQPREGDLLAPWRATEKLASQDAQAFERMLAEDPDLMRGLDAAFEERDETIALNEALPTPSRAALDRLMARVEADEAARKPKVAGFAAWLSSKLMTASPGTLAWGATAAALLIAVQAGLLARAHLTGGEGGYEMASSGQTASTGATALVAFQPGATAEQISTLLKGANAEIVAGPKPGGVFIVRLSAGPLEGDALEAALKPFRDNVAVVRMAQPGG